MFVFFYKYARWVSKSVASYDVKNSMQFNKVSVIPQRNTTGMLQLTAS